MKPQCNGTLTIFIAYYYYYNNYHYYYLSIYLFIYLSILFWCVCVCVEGVAWGGEGSTDCITKSGRFVELNVKIYCTPYQIVQ